MFTPPHNADDKPPRWYRECLGEVQERHGRLYFVPSPKHPGLRDLDETHCGIEGEPGTMVAVENAYRAALATKKAWKDKRAAERAERAVERGLKIAA